MSAKFWLGMVVTTPNALDQLSMAEIQTAVGRHERGDWGDVCAEDGAANDQALKRGDRLFSIYHASDGTKFWIITEADRSATCVMLPEDY